MYAATTTRPIAAKDEPAVAEVPREDAPGSEPSPVPPSAAAATKATPVQIALVALGAVAFLYFARPVVLPVFLACVAGMTLKPLIRWLSYCRLRPPFAAEIVLSVLLTGVGVGFYHLW